MFSYQGYTKLRCRLLYGVFSCNDKNTIAQVMDAGEQGVNPTSKGHSKVTRKWNYVPQESQHCAGSHQLPPPDKLVIRSLVLLMIQEPIIRGTQLEILDDLNPSPKTLVAREAILNWSFYFQAKSETIFPYAPEIVKFEFGSSHIRSK